jgi:hypothetical protein
MAGKKKSRVVEEVVVVADPAVVPAAALPPPEPIPEAAGLLAFSKTELDSMRLAELEAQVAQRDSQIAGMAKQILLSQLDPRGLLAAEDAKGANARRAFEQAKAKYRATLTSAAARLGVDPNKVSFDPDTGIINLAT